MTSSDPMIFAAHAGTMNDDELQSIYSEMQVGGDVSDFQQAVLDEARLRGILNAAEIQRLNGRP